MLKRLIQCFQIKIDENKVMSYIKLTPTYFEDGTLRVNIDSLTILHYGGKKYNKFLRSILIILSYLLVCGNGKKINYIYSQALSPISAWLLISNFYTFVNCRNRHKW